MVNTCPKCGLAYSEFRTGLTFRDVYTMLWSRKRKTRHTVLGKWREIKIGLFDEHINQCDLSEPCEGDEHFEEY